jgi:hypothetical protein
MEYLWSKCILDSEEIGLIFRRKGINLSFAIGHLKKK